MNLLQPKAFFYGNNMGIYPVLKDFLFRLNLRETTILQDKSDLIKFVNEDYWPIIFFNEDENNPLSLFTTLDNFLSTKGYELFSYILIATTDNKIPFMHSTNIGAKGCIKRPIQPNEAQSLLKEIININSDQYYNIAINIIKTRLNNSQEEINKELNELKKHPIFERAAEFTEMHYFTENNMYSVVKNIFNKKLHSSKRDIRFLSEAINFYRQISDYKEAIKYSKLILSENILIHKILEHIELCFEINNFEEVINTINKYQKIPEIKEHLADSISRLMSINGLGKYIQTYLKIYPQLYRNLTNQINKGFLYPNYISTNNK